METLPTPTFGYMHEAISYYAERGYVSLDGCTTETRRVMYNPTPGGLAPLIELYRVGFLEVRVRFLLGP